MPKGSDKGATRKRPALMSTAAPGSPEQPETIVEGLPQPTGAGTTIADNIRRHHTDLVAELGILFLPGKRVWKKICKRNKTNKKVATIFSTGKVDNMEYMCNEMMKKKVIRYGEYKLLSTILETYGRKEGQIIATYTAKIQEEREGLSKRQRKRSGYDQNLLQPKRTLRSTSVVFEDEDDTDPPQDKRQKTRE